MMGAVCAKELGVLTCVCFAHIACSGYIRLELPVFHIGYFKNTIQVLQCICKTCSRVLLPEQERQQWLRCAGEGGAWFAPAVRKQGGRA